MPTRFRPTKKQGHIRGLPTPKIEIIESMMVQGISAPEIAKKIQGEWGRLKEISPATLAKQIVRYKQNVIDPHMFVAVPQAPTEPLKEGEKPKHPEKQLVQFKKVSGKVDTLTNLNELVAIQQERFMKLYVIESKSPTLFDAMRKEMELLMKLLHQVSDLQFDTGMLVRYNAGSAGAQAGTPGGANTLDTPGRRSYEESMKFQEQFAEAASEVLKAMGMIKNSDGNTDKNPLNS